jgi:hypothetical protein
MMAPLKRYLKVPSMGTIFGAQEAAVAPEGEKARAFAKGAGIGALYGATSPGGRMGLNEVARAFEKEIPRYVEQEARTEAFRERPTREEPAAVEPSRETPQAELKTEGPQKRQRKFLKTIEEAAETEPELAERVKEVDPQEYVVQPNAESRARASNRIETEGLDKAVDYVLSEAELNAEKGATFITLAERFQKTGDFDRAADMVEAYDLQLREAGRFIQAASLWSQSSPLVFIRWANRQLESVRSKYGWADALFKRKPESFSLSREEQKFIMEKYREIGEMSDGIEKADATLELVDMVAQKVPPSVSEMIDAYRYQNMLSSPKTQMRNIGENIFNTFITAPVDVTTKGAIDYTKSFLTGSDRQNYVSDAPVYVKTAINSVPNAVKAFVETMKLTKGTEIGKPDVGIEARSEFQRARVKQLPPVLTVVPRFMEAADKFNMAIVGGGEMAIQKRKGVSDAEAYKKAVEAAEILLYRNRLDPSDPALSIPAKAITSLGKVVQESRKLPVLGTLSKWYVPFIRTPINKGAQMIERSPLGAIRDPRTFTEASGAKVLTGSIVSALGAIMAAEGQTTWAPPSDPKEKELFYASGRKPYSVRIPTPTGDRWVPIWYLGPYAVAFGIPMAAKYYAQDRKQAFTEDGASKLIGLAEGLTRFIGSQSSTQSIGALFSALGGDIDYTFASQTGFTAQQFIPAASLIRYINTIIDPIYRRPKGFVEQIEANLPVLSKRLEAHQTPFLEDARREPINYFLPYDTGKSDERFDFLLPGVREDARQRHLGNQIDKIAKEVRDEKITVEESLDKVLKIMQGQAKSAQKFGEELMEGDQ